VLRRRRFIAAKKYNGHGSPVIKMKTAKGKARLHGLFFTALY
jgi:hypothetical protein